MEAFNFISGSLLGFQLSLFHSPVTPTSDFILKLSYFARAVCLLGCFGWGEDLFILTLIGQVWFFRDTCQLRLKSLNP